MIGDLGEESSLTDTTMIGEITKVLQPKNVLGTNLNLYNHE